MKNSYIFPAKFTMDVDGISVEFPDIPGCFTCGNTEEEALKNAKDALVLHLYGMEQDNEPIPEPSKITQLKLGESQFVSMIQVNMIPFRDKMANKAEKITTTIPRWLKSLGDQEGVNYSYLLQEKLKEYLGINESKESHC